MVRLPGKNFLPLLVSNPVTGGVFENFIIAKKIWEDGLRTIWPFEEPVAIKYDKARQPSLLLQLA